MQTSSGGAFIVRVDVSTHEDPHAIRAAQTERFDIPTDPRQQRVARRYATPVSVLTHRPHARPEAPINHDSVVALLDSLQNQSEPGGVSTNEPSQAR